MKMSDLFPATYLKQEDVPFPMTLTIARIAIEQIGGGREKEEKPVLYFAKTEKGLVLNRTNGDILSEAFGDDSDNWIGKVVQLYSDPNVIFAGKRVGGLRLQVPKEQVNGDGKTTEMTLVDAYCFANRHGMDNGTLALALQAKGIKLSSQSVNRKLVSDLVAEYVDANAGSSAIGTDKAPF